MDIFFQLLLQFILILLNAFFAATEIAIISLNEKKVKARKNHQRPDEIPFDDTNWYYACRFSRLGICGR